MITTITTTSGEDARIIVAFGTYLGLGRNATAQEVKSAAISWMRDIVAQQERNVAIAEINITPINPT